MRRTCPRCKRRELPPRYRVCDECLTGVPAESFQSKPIPKQSSQWRVIDQLRRHPVRSVQLYCSCTVSLDGRWWQTDDYKCETHGPTWVARVTREKEN